MNHLYSFFTLKADRNLRRIANDLLVYGPPRLFGGGVIVIDSKCNMRCLVTCEIAYVSEECKKKSEAAWKAEEDEELNTVNQELLLISLST